MQIPWWLAPAVVATVLAMLRVPWLGRGGRGHVDPEVAVRRLGDAMARPTRAPRKPPPGRESSHERGTGVAVRPSTRSAGDTRRAS